jgi:hypothetical protein
LCSPGPLARAAGVTQRPFADHVVEIKPLTLTEMALSSGLHAGNASLYLVGDRVDIAKPSFKLIVA